MLQLLEKDPAKRPPDGLVLHRQLDRLRRKLERKVALTNADARGSATRLDDGSAVMVDGGPGGATLMSRMMRSELEREQRGGSLTQFINQPLVLVLLLATCIGLIVWVLHGPTPAPRPSWKGPGR